MFYSIIIPVYHGEKTIKSLTERILNDFQKDSLEIIFVYDCGPDQSWETIVEIQKQHPDIVKGIHLSKNFGQHNAIICGIEQSKGDYIITMDEDLQHQPKDIRNLIAHQKEGNYDVVYGVYHQLKHSGFRNLTSNIMAKLLEVSIPGLDKNYTAFRLIKSSIAKQLTTMQNSYTFLDGYISWITTNTSSTKVEHQERMGGTSSYTVKKLIEHSINIFVTFSIIPIRMLSYLSIFTLISTICYSIYIIVRKFLLDDLLSGFPSLMIVIGFGVSFILLGLGIVGEYIHRINLKTTKKPNYSIKESV
ncbi:MAG: glycosyltransferase family 2 protein [Flavobacteriales bacterium]|jgi:undecaprenyl-phosphate 4-deoxy-4-formamido-L-arabinose transferase|nr:glycosyltransferase family 2 protein [Flavobacteriales bacterium]